MFPFCRSCGGNRRCNLQLNIDPSLDGLGKVDGRVVDQDREVVLARVHDVGHESQTDLTGGVLHLDGVGQDQGTVCLEGGAVSVGGQLENKGCEKKKVAVRTRPLIETRCE